MCCTWLARNTGRKNDAKTRHLGTIAQLCRDMSSQLRHVSTIGKKLVQQQYLPHTSSQYGELRPTSGWDRFGSLGHSHKFQQVSCLGFVTAATSLTGGQPNFARCLAICWAGTWYIHFGGLLPPWQNFVQCKIHFVSKSCVLLYWQRYCTALQQRASAKLCCMAKGMELPTFQRLPPIFGWAAITLGIGPHSSSIQCTSCHKWVHKKCSGIKVTCTKWWSHLFVEVDRILYSVEAVQV